MQINQLQVMDTILKCILTLYFGFQILVLPCQEPVPNISGFTESVTGLEELGLNTGDLLFFQSREFPGFLVQIASISNFTHVAMVVKDPDNGELWLTHSTDNDYRGFSFPARNENKSRDGVIMTRLQSSFFSTNDLRAGFYRKIWVYQLNEDLVKRPDAHKVIAFYEKNKHHQFETSLWRYFLCISDLYLLGKDFFSTKVGDKRFCSEYIFNLMTELAFPIDKNQQPNEHTPADICYLINPLYHSSRLFIFRDGAFRIVNP